VNAGAAALCGTFFHPNDGGCAVFCCFQFGCTGGKEEDKMSYEKEIRNYMASCPVCGKGLCRAAPKSVVEIYCPKCKSSLLVSFENNGFSAKIIENTSEDKSGHGSVC